jgi:hypothetical protein
MPHAPCPMPHAQEHLQKSEKGYIYPLLGVPVFLGAVIGLCSVVAALLNQE